MRVLTSAASIAALCVAGATLTIPTATADTEGCVSRKEHRRIEDGKSKRRVHAIYDTSGGYLDTLGASSYSRIYVGCGAFYTTVSYVEFPGGKHRVFAKSLVVSN